MLYRPRLFRQGIPVGPKNRSLLRSGIIFRFRGTFAVSGLHLLGYIDIRLFAFVYGN